METTRRNFIRTTTGAGLAGLLLPSWLFPRETRAVAIDFSLFCEDHAGPRFDMSRPFLQSGSIYATDGRHGIRVGKDALVDLPGEEAKLPPAERLPWADPDSNGWRSVNSFERVYYKSRIGCPTCNYRGRVGPDVHPCICTKEWHELTAEQQLQCAKDDGEWDWCGCDGREVVGGQPCDECDGRGTVDYAYELGGVQVAPMMVKKHLTLPGVEFRPGRLLQTSRPNEIDGMSTRFVGGVGLIAGLIKD